MSKEDTGFLFEEDKYTGFWRFLNYPRLLTRPLIYKGRPNVVTQKTRGPHWAMLHSEWRHWHSLLCYLGPPCFILWRIKWPMLLNMAIAVVITVDAYLDIYQFHGNGFLPNVEDAVTQAWRMISFVMSLLLAFRVNRTYERWWLARQSFAGVGNAAITLSQQTVVWVKDPTLQSEIIRWCCVWHWSIYQICMGQQDLHPRAAAFLSPQELDYYSRARKGRYLVLLRLRQLLAKAKLPMEHALLMENTISRGFKFAGNCVRLRFQAMPYAYTLITTGFVEIFLIFQPFGLIPSPDIISEGTDSIFSHGLQPVGALIIYFFCAVLLLGVDECANTLENPFPSLPMMDIVESTLRDVLRTLDEAAMMEELGAPWLTGYQPDPKAGPQAATATAVAAEVEAVADASAACDVGQQHQQTPARGDQVVDVFTRP